MNRGAQPLFVRCRIRAGDGYVLEPVREQGLIVYEIPEDALPEDHTARLLWRVVETLDLSRFLSQAKAVEGQQGRRVLSIRVLLTVWLYAISRGIGSAREIETVFDERRGVPLDHR